MSNPEFVQIGDHIIVPDRAHDWSVYYKVNKFGANGDIDAGATGDIWDYGPTADLAWPAAAAETTVVSSDAADDGDPGGTGARTVSVQGLDGSYNLATETATLNGTSAVTLTTQFLRVFRIIVLTAGSGGTNAGTIDVKHGSTVLGRIQIGNAQTLMACYTVPAGYTAYMMSFYSSMLKAVTTGAVDISVWARPLGGVFNLKHTTAVIGTGTSYVNHVYSVLPGFAAKTDIYMTGTATANNTSINAGFDLFVVKDAT